MPVDPKEAPAGFAAAPAPPVNGKDRPSCNGCAFNLDHEKCRANPCGPTFRADEQFVIFVRKS